MKHDLIICGGPLPAWRGHYVGKDDGDGGQNISDVPAGPYHPDKTAPSDSPSAPGTKTEKTAHARCETPSAAARHPFHVLLPKQAQALRRRALKLASNEAQADDLVQATMLKAWAKRDTYKPGTQLRAWLFTILRNTFFSELRKYRREVEDVDGILAGTLYEEPRQDHALALKELISAVASLPEIQRKPLVLMGAYGYSQLEAADACGCSVGTIKSRVNRGRLTLTRTFVDEPTIRHGVLPRPRIAPRRAECPMGTPHSADISARTATE